MRLKLDLIDEKRSEALTCLIAQKRKVEKYYNAKTKRRSFAIGSYILKKVFQNATVQGDDVLGQNWKGQYIVHREIYVKTYYIKYIDGTLIIHP